MTDILIVGTGALATLFASRLTQAGCRVIMLGTWPEGIRALRENGARLVDANGSEQTFRVSIADDPKTCRGIKHALVLVKSWQTERAARQLIECLAEDGLAVTLQNGLGNREILAKHLDDPITTPSVPRTPAARRCETAESTEITEKEQIKDSVRSVNSVVNRPSRVALGTTTTGATLLGPGLVKAGGEGVTSIEAHPALGPLKDALTSANFKVEIVNDARSLVWGKLVINAAINPLTALLRVTNGELLERPAARVLMRALAEEAARVAAAEKVKLPFSDPPAIAEEVARRTATNQSSMLQDVRRGAPTEIDAICGAITQVGRQHNLATPVNQTCWQLIRALVQSPNHGAPSR